MNELDEARPGAGDCAETLRELYVFLDGELTDDRRHQIQHHLDACGTCLEVFDFEAEVRMMVAHKCRDEAPESLRRRIAAALHPADDL